jgi:hypothetical protein
MGDTGMRMLGRGYILGAVNRPFFCLPGGCYARDPMT